MTTKRYKVILQGTLAEGFKLEKVKKNVTALFPKLDAENAENLFGRGPIVIKKDVNYETAARYQKAFEKAGAVCTIEQITMQSEPKDDLIDEEISSVPNNRSSKIAATTNRYNATKKGLNRPNDKSGYSTCWFCNDNKAQIGSALKVKLSREEENRTTYRSIYVPRCSRCALVHFRTYRFFCRGIPVGVLIGIILFIYFLNKGVPFWSILMIGVFGSLGGFIGQLIGEFTSKTKTKSAHFCNKFQQIKELLKKGWDNKSIVPY